MSIFLLYLKETVIVIGGFNPCAAFWSHDHRCVATTSPNKKHFLLTFTMWGVWDSPTVERKCFTFFLYAVKLSQRDGGSQLHFTRLIYAHRSLLADLRDLHGSPCKHQLPCLHREVLTVMRSERARLTWLKAFQPCEPRAT